MSTTTADLLPLTEHVAPADQDGVAAAVAAAYSRRAAVYPIGGATSLDYGLTAKRPGIGLALAGLNRVVDYPARDLTITVESGVTMHQLAQTLAAERQWLPLDVPQPQRATVGGVVATAWSGPRRFGLGTVRDYVIGISAVDGRGQPYKGGGRVVKNVAGYDFCKLLTGSLGTLGVITQLTFKIKPAPQRSALVFCDLSNWEDAEARLAALVHTQVTSSAVELIAGPAWNDAAGLPPLSAGAVARLCVGLEGTEPEVTWMLGQISAEWRQQGVPSSATLTGDDAQPLWNALREFSALGGAPLVVKASLRPGAVTSFARLVLEIDPAASLQAHAGSGVVIARFVKFEAAQVSRALVGRLHPAARAAGGGLVVLSSDGLGELTHQACWGAAGAAVQWMTRLKDQFDPRGLLNPGRFVYENR